jgi:MFS family permease
LAGSCGHNMNAAAKRIRNTYLLLDLLQTLAASFIWGINTLFLLDAGLSNAEAFAANAFFTAGMVLFEVPTGVVADTHGRRVSFLLGTVTLTFSTILYLLMWKWSASLWAWAISSALLGLGFTFFSGAFQAWLVDALTFAGYVREGGKIEDVLATGSVVEGIAMLAGSVAGGAIAQSTNLGVPYIIRALVLVVTFFVAFAFMRDTGFQAAGGRNLAGEIKAIVRSSLKHGLGNRPVRWIMLTAPFTGGVSIYAFYAMQPYLLRLYGDEKAYGIAGLAAAIMAGAQIAGGLAVPHLARIFGRRTTVVLMGTAAGSVCLAGIGLLRTFWSVILLLVLWGLTFAAVTPVRQAYLNELIPSNERATVLSFDSMLGSTGAVGIQPVLGRVADIWSYPASYVVSAAIQALALPFAWLARKEGRPEDELR